MTEDHPPKGRWVAAPLTLAERQARFHARRKSELVRLRRACDAVQKATTLRDAQVIAMIARMPEKKGGK